MQFYKANKANKGCACNFSFNSKEAALFVSIIRQVGYDESRHIGSFAGGERTVLKFSVPEIGGMIDTLRNNKEFATYHTGNDTKTAIRFAPYYFGEGDAKVQKGFGLTVNRLGADNKVVSSWLMPFNFWEAQVVIEYLVFVLNHIFSAEYAESKKAYQNRVKTNKPMNVPVDQEVPEKTPEEAPEEEI